MDTLNMEVFRRAKVARSVAATSLYNLSKSMFGNGRTIKYRVASRDVVGIVEQVYRDGYEILIDVKPISGSGKSKKVNVDQVVGILQE